MFSNNCHTLLIVVLNDCHAPTIKLSWICSNKAVIHIFHSSSTCHTCVSVKLPSFSGQTMQVLQKLMQSSHLASCKESHCARLDDKKIYKHLPSTLIYFSPVDGINSNMKASEGDNCSIIRTMTHSGRETIKDYLDRKLSRYGIVRCNHYGEVIFFQSV